MIWECAQVGVTEGRLRKWLLSIAAFLRSQNGGLADAMRLWRDNCVREFDGVEECLICYSGLHLRPALLICPVLPRTDPHCPCIPACLFFEHHSLQRLSF